MVISSGTLKIQGAGRSMPTIRLRERWERKRTYCFIATKLLVVP